MGWIYAAFSALGVLLGFLMGGSETSVVHVAIPALAGVVTAALATVVNRGSAQDLEKLLKDVQTQLAASGTTKLGAGADKLARQSTHAARYIGIATFLFAVGYGGGTVFGSWIRISGTWARAFANLEQPWPEAEGALNFKARADWLVYRQQLQAAGAPKELIANMFRAYYQAHTEKARVPVKPWLDGTNAADVPLGAIVEWLALEPSLALAGLTDEQITALWPVFIASLQAPEKTSVASQPSQDENTTDEAVATPETGVQVSPVTILEGCVVDLATFWNCQVHKTDLPGLTPQSPLLLPEAVESLDPSMLDRYYTAPSAVPN